VKKKSWSDLSGQMRLLKTKMEEYQFVPKYLENNYLNQKCVIHMTENDANSG
jgi:hypothetical protein